MMDYLITYSHQQSQYSEEQIHEVVASLPVSDWWHYLPNVYIVRSIHDEKVLADGISARNPGLLFLVIGVNLSKTNGVLNKSAWDWINNNIKLVFKIKPVPAPIIGRIFGSPPSIDNTQKQSPVPQLLSDLFNKK